MNIDDFIKENPLLGVEPYTQPHQSVIYFICENDGEIIYIGTTMNQRLRFKEHSARIEFHDKPIYLFYYEKDKCGEFESELITQIKPERNIQYNINREREIYHGKRTPYGGTNIKETKLFQEELTSALNNNKMSQNMFAKKIGLSRQRVHQILHNESLRATTIKKLRKLIKVVLK